MARVLVGLFALATGCFTKPEPPMSTGGSRDAGASDGDIALPADDGGGDAMAPCTLHDDFNAPAASCGPWGVAIASPGVAVAHNTDQLRFLSTGGGQTICKSVDQVNIASGARVQITSAPSDNYAYTRFEVFDELYSTTVGIRIDGKGSASPMSVVLETPPGPQSPAAYSSQQMLWWQLRTEVEDFATPAIGTTYVVAEYSPDPTTFGWIELGRYNAGVGQQFTKTTVRLSAQFGSMSATPIAFDNLDACPP